MQAHTLSHPAQWARRWKEGTRKDIHSIERKTVSQNKASLTCGGLEVGHSLLLGTEVEG